MRDLLAGAALHRHSIAQTVIPGRITHLTNHPVFHLSSINGGPGIAFRFSLQRDFFIQPGCGFRSLHFHAEFGAFILFHLDLGVAFRALTHLEAHRSREPVVGSLKVTGKGTIGIGSQGLNRNILAVDIQKGHSQALVRQ